MTVSTKRNTEKLPCFLILLALIIRATLSALGWPSTDSDEGLIGLQALHIANLGEHPTFLYGQNYMGTIEPYIASLFFRLFGVSSFVLRLSTLFLFGLFLIFMYLLTRLLYSRNAALLVLLVLSLGTQLMLIPQIMVEGGVVETLACGALLMLLTSYLALTSSETPAWTRPCWRLTLYACWGLTAGAALWSDYLICPWLLMASLLLAFFCWREWKTGAPVSLLTGFIVGALPLLIYNLHPAPGQNFIQVISSLHNSTVPNTMVTPLVVLQEFAGTFLYGLPGMSGLAPLCGLGDLPVYGPMTVHTVLCGALNGAWSLGYVALLLIASALSFVALRDGWRLYRIHVANPAAWSVEKRRSVVLHALQLMLLLAAALTLALYASSPISGQRPWSTRYITCLLIATPAILWPLWRGMSGILISPHLLISTSLIRRGLMIVIVLVFALGTVLTFQQVPAAAALDQQEYQLIPDLLNIHVTHIYSEYWTCGRIIFQSQEKITCAVVITRCTLGITATSHTLQP